MPYKRQSNNPKIPSRWSAGRKRFWGCGGAHRAKTKHSQGGDHTAAV